MKPVGIAGIGLVAPGIENWPAGEMFLASGEVFDATQPFPLLQPNNLSANERRRTTRLIKIAMECGHQAAGSKAVTLHTVFASAHGDLNIVDKILTALTLDTKPVSPTHFHNSVHNAPAGYWSIASASEASTISIAAGEYTFVTGLLEAITQVLYDNTPVLYIACDDTAPTLLQAQVQVVAPFGMALLLTPEPAQWKLGVQIQRQMKAATFMPDPGFEYLRNSNPAACGLPILGALALKKSTCICLPYQHQQVLDIKLDFG